MESNFGFEFTSIPYQKGESSVLYIIRSDYRDFFAYPRTTQFDLDDNLFPELIGFWKIRGKNFHDPRNNDELCSLIQNTIIEKLADENREWIEHVPKRL